MWSFFYGVVQIAFWIAGRIEDTRTRKIKKSDLEIREELSHEVQRKAGQELPSED